MKEPELWEQQPKETSPAFHNFTHYRDLGPSRSVDRAFRVHVTDCQKRKLPPGERATGSWGRQYTRWKWGERARAWDAEADRHAREAAVDELTDRRKSWIESAKEVQQAGRALRALHSRRVFREVERITQNPALLDTMPMGRVPRGIEVGANVELEGIRTEMLLLGEATERTDVTGIDASFDAIVARAKELAIAEREAS